MSEPKRKRINPRKDQFLFYIIFAIIFAYIVFHLNNVLDWLLSVASLATPFYIALVIAFLLNIPMRGFEHLFDRLGKKIKLFNFKKDTKRVVAIFSTLAVFVLIIVLFTSIIVPRIGDSISMIFSNLNDYAVRLANWLNKMTRTFHLKKTYTTSDVNNFFDSVNLNTILSTLGNFVTSDDNASTASVVNSISGTTVTTITAFFMAVYLLFNKEKHITQFRKVLCYFFGAERAVQILEICEEGSHYFNSFITGQVLEATVFMTEIYIMTKVFHFPFAELIAVCAFLFSFIPMFGSFLTLCIGTVLVAAADSKDIFLFIVLFVITQQFEGNVVYPRIVGKKVGISGLYVLIGITFFGNLWGIFGVVAGVPITALLYATLSRLINISLYRRGIYVTREHIAKTDEDGNKTSNLI